MTRWYLAFAAFAAAIAAVSGQPIERCWGTWAAIGYATAAAITAAASRRDRQASAIALGCVTIWATICATVAPLAWQAFAGLPSRAGEGSLTVIAQAGGQLLRHGTPYLPAASLTHVLAYDPYEPLMAVFGLPNSAGLTGWPASPRLWLALAGIMGVYLAFRTAGGPPRQALPRTALALASPVLSLPLATGGTDLPVIASLCLTLALAERAPRRAALAAGAACALKAIAWPAVPVIAAMLTAARGARAGWRFTVTAAVTAVAAMAAAAPGALSDPGAAVQNAILFPLGLTSHRSPAASSLPGHLLAAGGPAGKWAGLALLAAAAAAFAWWLARRPPRTTQAAAVRLAVGLTAAITLAPAARWGYFAYPVALLGWLRLSRPAGFCSYSSERTVATPSAFASVSAGGVSAGGASSGAETAPASG